MADAVLYVQGLAGVQKSAKALEDGTDRALRKELRAALAPIVAQAKASFRSLPGVGRRTATTVRGSVTGRGVAVQFSGRFGFEQGREWGAKPRVKPATYQLRTPAGPVTATRFLDYSRPSIFGQWQGNQFSVAPGGRVSGRAFHPAVKDGLDDAVDRVVATIDRYANQGSS